MFTKTIAATFFALFFALAVLANPAPTPVIEARQIDSIISSATSVAGSIASQVTSVAASVGSDITSVGGDITSLGGGLIETITSVGGKAITIISSQGGEAITLATDGAGKVTSVFGSVYTVATAAAASATSSLAHNGAISPSVGVSTPLFVGLATILASTLLGAFITI